MTGRGSSFLKGYNRHLLLGILASGGSLYLITTPLYVFVSSTRAPESSKLGFSLSAAGAASPSSPPAPKAFPFSASCLKRFSRRRSLFRSLCAFCSLNWSLFPSRSLSRSLCGGLCPSLFICRLSALFPRSG